MIDMYFTPDEPEHLDQVGIELDGCDGRQAEHDWAQLIEVVSELTEAVKAEQAAGTEATDPRMLELARQWRALIDRLTRDDDARVASRVARRRSDRAGELRLAPHGARQGLELGS